jgi:hypothetical protein
MLSLGTSIHVKTTKIDTIDGIILWHLNGLSTRGGVK